MHRSPLRGVGDGERYTGKEKLRLDKIVLTRLYIEMLVFAAASITYCLLIHKKIKSDIRKWASDKDLSILEMEWMPWQKNKILSGFHPANFWVSVEDGNKNVEKYEIWHRIFWLIHRKNLGVRTLEKEKNV